MFWPLELGVGLGGFFGFVFNIDECHYFQCIIAPGFFPLCNFDVPCCKYSAIISNKETSSLTKLLMALQIVFLEL